MSSRRYDLISVGLILLLGAAYQLLFLREGVGLIDEGHLANAARRLAGGDVLYRDVYSVYPPASFYVVSALFKSFGTSLIVVRAFHVVMTLACAVAAYGWARLFMPRGWAWLGGMLVATTGWEAILERCHYSYLYSVFPLLAMFLYWRGSSGDRGRDELSAALLVGVGALAGVTLTFRLVPFVGVVVALGISVLCSSGLNRKSVRQLTWMGLGAALVLVPVLLFFVANDALDEGMRAVFWTSFGQYLEGDMQGGDFNLPFPALQFWPRSFSRGGLQSLWLNWEFYLPVALYFLVFCESIFRLLRLRSSGVLEGDVPRGEEAWVARLSMAMFGAVLFLRATGRSDYYHLAPVLVPAYLLGVDTLARLYEAMSERMGYGGVSDRPILGTALPVAVLLLSLFLHDVDGAARRIRDGEGKVALAEGGPFVREAGALDDLVASIRRGGRPGEKMIVLPWYPVLYFLAERENPTRYDWLFPGYLRTESEVEGYIEAIEGSRVRRVVYSPAAIDGRRDRSLAGFSPRLDRYLRENFRSIKRFGTFHLMERRTRASITTRERRR